MLRGGGPRDGDLRLPTLTCRPEADARARAATARRRAQAATQRPFAETAPAATCHRLPAGPSPRVAPTLAGRRVPHTLNRSVHVWELAGDRRTPTWGLCDQNTPTRVPAADPPSLRRAGRSLAVAAGDRRRSWSRVPKGGVTLRRTAASKTAQRGDVVRRPLACLQVKMKQFRLISRLTPSSGGLSGNAG